MGSDMESIERMVPYTLSEDTPNRDALNDKNPNEVTPNRDGPNDKNPNEDTSDIKNDSKATTPGTSSNHRRKVITNPTDDEILAAQGLLELFREARVFSTTAKMATYPANVKINSRLLSRAGRSKFPPYSFSVSNLPTIDQVGTANSTVVGGVDKSQNVLARCSPFSPYVSTTIRFEKANGTSSAKAGNEEGSASVLYPPICPHSTWRNIKEVKGMIATSVLSPPSVFPPLLSPPYSSTSESKEEVDDTAAMIVKSKEPKESEKKHYLNRDSKKRKADEAYIRKKVEVYQKMELYRDD